MSPTVANYNGVERTGSDELAITSGTGARNSGGGPAGLVWSPVVRDSERSPSQTLSRPNLNRNQSNTSAGSGSEGGNRLSATSSLRSNAKRVSVMERTLIQVTEDNERFSVVDISGLNSAAAIKERMMSKLREYLVVALPCLWYESRC
jgi:hypothetical protein